jgi:hypothetical protein
MDRGRRAKKRGILAQRQGIINRTGDGTQAGFRRLTLFRRRGYDGRESRANGVSAIIYRTWSDPEAQLIKGILELYGIPVSLSSDISHTLYPFTLDGLGETRVLVPLAAEGEAHIILAGHRSPTGSVDA